MELSLSAGPAPVENEGCDGRASRQGPKQRLRARGMGVEQIGGDR